MKTNSNTYQNKINQEDKHKNYSIKVYEEKETHSPYIFLFCLGPNGKSFVSFIIVGYPIIYTHINMFLCKGFGRLQHLTPCLDVK